MKNSGDDRCRSPVPGNSLHWASRESQRTPIFEDKYKGYIHPFESAVSGQVIGRDKRRVGAKEFGSLVTI